MVPSTTMDKRKNRDEDAISPVVATYDKRRKIEFGYGDNGPDVVGETELASAFALASLASFSPQSTNHDPSPEARDVELECGDDDEEESITSFEARSPKDEPIPITPDARSPIRHSNKRVTFDPRIKNHVRMAARQLSIPARVKREHGSRMPSGFRRAYPPNRGPLPIPWMRHRMMGPPPGFMPPSMMPPPLPDQWICDFCNVASFATYQEACVHEDSCSLRCNIPPQRLSMWHPHAPHSMQITQSFLPSSLAESTRAFQQQHLPSASSREWNKGRTFLAVPESDAEWLSELNCFIRTSCVEAFSATDEHVSRTSKRGRITLHQVGIRCTFCSHRMSDDKAMAAVSFPTSVAGIYESVKRWQRVHMEVCKDIPSDIREMLGKLVRSNASVPTTRQYWADSAKALGMVDTEDGIRFALDPHCNHGTEAVESTKPSAVPLAASAERAEESTISEGYPIVYQEDLNLVPVYVHFLMSQVESCRFTEADRFVARSKGPVGYPGFQCKHCSGHAGLGKYFPVSSKSLATNSTSQNIHAHLLKCRKCPADLKRHLVALKEEKSKAPRLEPGWRKVFFDKVWERMHGCITESGTRGF